MELTQSFSLEAPRRYNKFNPIEPMSASTPRINPEMRHNQSMMSTRNYNPNMMQATSYISTGGEVERDFAMPDPVKKEENDVDIKLDWEENDDDEEDEEEDE